MNKKFTLILLMAIIAIMASAQTTFNDGTFKYELMTLNTTGETVAKITSWYAIPSGTNITVNVPGYVTYNGTRYRVSSRLPPHARHYVGDEAGEAGRRRRSECRGTPG